MSQCRRTISVIPTVALLALVTATVVPTAVASSGRHAQSTSATYRRCGFTSSPYGRLGIYVIMGKVRCSKAEWLIHQSFYVAGEPTYYGDSERYPGNWICGGQMGYYTCSEPSPAHPSEQVEGRACSMRGVGCPRKTRY